MVTHQGLDSTRSLRVFSGVWSQEVSSKPCQLLDAASMDQNYLFPARSIDQGWDSVDSTKRLFSLTLPITSVEKSESAYVSVLGDILGTALQNLDHLITMPYGCGEQNMATMATIIYVLDYLKATRQVEATQKAKAIRYLQNGYQRQLSYKRKDGSYSAFGLDSEEGSTWLTAFVMKCFYWARGYAFIDEDVLKQGMSWLKKQQKRDGCFIRRGQLFQTVMKGRVEDDVSLSAYITAALLEAGTRLNDPVLLRALSCLKPKIFLSSNPYTMALLAYTFALAKDLKSKAILMDKLMKVSKSSGADLYWEYIPLYSGGLFSANVELSSYVLLALTTAPSSNDILKASRIVSWLIKQQNPYGGFYSTQDTVVAIQALAKYARIKFSPEDSLLVSVSKKEETLKVFKVDKTNSLLLQTAPLPDIPEQYGLLVQGTGCVYIQSVLKYNVLTVLGSSDFTISATGTCNSGPELLQLLIQFRYIGNRKVTNMVLIEVEMLSGYQLYDQTGLEIKELPLVKRVEIKQNSVIIYLEQLDQTSHQSRFLILRKHLVQDLKPANIKVYDYYQTEESAVTTYSGCS
ncbi:alpha-2-macroglobulin-like protein 1 [Dendropsophus ebraccatus]|uniref:alpha-2-macroglobulin-like protein 1 n=1 Tax=Dendropsophus ebraccatus TaxID=150705 RepID=UPI0038321350